MPSSLGWYQTPMGYLFSQLPLSKKQLQSRLETKRNSNTREDHERIRRKSKNAKEKVEKGPTSMYFTLNLYTALPNISALIAAMNIDLRKSNLRVSLEPLQCWESNSKKMLCGVQSRLCVAGVSQLLLHRLKEMEKKLCRHGRLSTLEWYNKQLPPVNVALCSIREL